MGAVKNDFMMSWACVSNGRTSRSLCNEGKTFGKEPHGRQRIKLEGNTKIIFTEIFVVIRNGSKWPRILSRGELYGN